ncbi:MAG TPA: tetratricopeptide repeat protein [Gaiellaceae bacterium]|nr:tetratricopeptide repeat protein [Gaiellaceae bacterium]
MGLSIHVLGPPRLERGGAPAEPPRGNKAWGLLVFLLRTRLPPSRERLAGLLFPEADDPLGTLRWTLSELRRSLGDDADVGGDPVRLTLHPGTLVDVDVLNGGSWMEAVALPGFGHELVDGLTVRSSPGFEMWLEDERRHVAGTTSAVLHQAALALLGRGQAADAVRHASELVRLNPYEENAHVLLVRCLRAAGDPEGAASRAEACTELFRRELGIEPSGALRTAAEASEAPVVGRVSSGAAVLAQIEAGEAALAAGAVDAGVQRMRGAVAAARTIDERELLARALVSLGGALVHSARGRDEEGAASLHEGVTLAEQAGRADVAATGWREISWVQFLRAQYERAEASLTRTAELAAGANEELAWVDLTRGACRHDTGDYAAAGELLRSGVERARRLPSGQPLAQALTLLGRYHLLRGEIEDAVHVLDQALAEVDARGMTAFVSWPESFRAEVDLALGDVDAAEARFEHAFALGCQVGDACWESIGLRGLGLVAAARGDVPRALDLLVEAPRLCRRLPDTYLWIEAYALDALCAVAVEHRAEAALRWIDELEAVTARRGIRELLVHATIYRARLGEPGAAEAARSLAAQVDNPALDGLLGLQELAADASY